MNSPFENEVSMRRTGFLLLLLAVAVALVLAAVAVLSQFWNVMDSPDLRSGGARQGPAPALETAPQPALQAYLAEKRRISESYAWTDASRRQARIPVEAAMRALAERSGLPADRRAAYLMGLEEKP